MKTSPLFLPVGFVLALAVATVAFAADPAAPQPLMKLPSFAPAGADGDYQVYGIVQIGSVYYASIKGPQAPQGRWCRLHEVFADQVVDDITAELVVLRNRQTGRQRTLRPIAAPMGAGATADEPTPAAAASGPALVPFSKAWINSKENPMLHVMQQLPVEIVMEWPDLPTEQKQAIIDYYEKHGWRLLGVETVGRSSSFHWENIYEKERSAAMSANRRDFVASLNDEQRAAYEAIKRNPMMQVLNGQLTPEQEVERKRRAEASAKFKASLTPEQRAQQESITDFTKRLGVPDAK